MEFDFQGEPIVDRRGMPLPTAGVEFSFGGNQKPELYGTGLASRRGVLQQLIEALGDMGLKKPMRPQRKTGYVSY